MPTVPSIAMNVGDFYTLFERVASFGKTEKGGLYRLAASQEEGLARDFVCDWLRQRAFEIEIDAVGNVFALLRLAGPKDPWVLSGSHLDSQPFGGRFDGALGVIGACVAADAIRRAEQQVFCKNLAVVIWTNEEGARYAPSMLGSGVYAGHYDVDYALSRTDAAGVSLSDALLAIGYRGEGQGPAKPAACIELHIEQGPALERAGAQIGVVRGNWGTMKYLVTFTGVAAHTGPTAMAERRDAMLAAAHMILACRQLSDRTGGALLSSVGRMDIFPNSSNVVAAETTLYTELRSTDNAQLEQACLELEAQAQEIARATATTVKLQRVTNRPAGVFDQALGDLIGKIAEECAYEKVDLFTVAGHDAISLRLRCPTAMIFVPSVAGVSHNETELTHSADLEAGLQVLGKVLMTLVRDPA